MTLSGAGMSLSGAGMTLSGAGTALRDAGAAFSKEKVVTVTAEDFIDREAIAYTEFTGKNGEPCLIQVLVDTCGENPREWTNPFWTWCTGSKEGYSDIRNETPDNYLDEDGRLDRQFLKDNLVVPLYLCRHSGDCISLRNTQYLFTDPWDSGCMGFAYVSRAEILKQYGWKRLTRKRWDELVNRRQGEVEEMNDWLSGNVYGIKVLDMQTEEEDAVYGYYGIERTREAVREMLYGWAAAESIEEIADRIDV